MQIISANYQFGLEEKVTGEVTQSISFCNEEKGYFGTTDQEVLDVLICRMEQRHRKLGDKASYMTLLHLKQASEFLAETEKAK